MTCTSGFVGTVDAVVVDFQAHLIFASFCKIIMSLNKVMRYKR